MIRGNADSDTIIINKTNLFTGISLFLLLACVTGINFSCTKDPEINKDADTYTLKIPFGFTQPHIPDDNPLTAEKIALGKKLFYETALSVDSTISCASCHKLENAMADHIAISHGVGGATGFRNAPTLVNLAWAPVLTMDGGNPTLETQIYIPLETHFEMDFNMVLLTERLNNDAEYVADFENVFGTAPDPFGITRSIAAFERTLISGNSKYDQYTRGILSAMNTSEINGMELFFSPELNCGGCHGGFLFTDNSFKNDGFFSDYSADSGQARITWLHADVGKFRVPTLRNIELTAPYMHNGSVATLDAIIDQYAAGGSGHENQSPLIKPFTLTDTEKFDLINFLKALSDNTFISNPDFYAE